MFGFELDFWDYATFVAILLGLVAVISVLLWLAGLPGRIAIARKHPDAEAVKQLGWAGFLLMVVDFIVLATTPSPRATVTSIAKMPAEARTSITRAAAGVATTGPQAEEEVSVVASAASVEADSVGFDIEKALKVGDRPKGSQLQ